MNSAIQVCGLKKIYTISQGFKRGDYILHCYIMLLLVVKHWKCFCPNSFISVSQIFSIPYLFINNVKDHMA